MVLIAQFVLLIVLCLALLGAAVYLSKLRRVAIAAPKLMPLETGKESVAAREHSVLPDPQPQFPLKVEQPLISVIIPAYNEAENIAECVRLVLDNVEQDGSSLDIWVVDDQSTDNTWVILQTLQQNLKDVRLHTLQGRPRPTDRVWMGKTWACIQGAEQAKGEFLLFLDADVRLKPGAIAAVLDLMQREPIDLLTLCPAIRCGCLGEWLIQPLVVGMLAVGYDFTEVNDPKQETAFANGQFMLFRRSAYESLEGHRAVAGEVVEDVELARLVKQRGLRLKYLLGHDLASVRMYPSFAAIWEGWTKNWYLGSQRNLSLTLYIAATVLLVCLTPFLGMMAVIVKLGAIGLNWFDLVLLGLALSAIVLQYDLRRQIERVTTIPPRYWWLTGISGVLVAVIAIASIIKTETGWGWTWRGRQLKQKAEG